MIKELLKQPGGVKYFFQLDFSKNKELQDLVSVAAQICNTPIALITFMDNEEQLIKVRLGTDAQRNTKEHSFCKHISSSDELFIVNDASKDQRFINNPLVTGDNHIRFYAGAPLCTDQGEILGSLCVLSQQAQELNEEQKKMLFILSKQAYRLMELEINNIILKQRTQELEEQKQELTRSSNKLKAIFESSPDCFMLIDCDLNVIAFNKSLSILVQKLKNLVVKSGMNAREFMNSSIADIYQESCNKALSEKKGHIIEKLLTYSNEKQVWWSISFNPAYDVDGKVIGISVNARDISQKKAYQEKLLQQNERLKKIAFIQSHELRKPLANILGLISLIKMQDNFCEIHQHLETSAFELDEHLRDAAKHAENPN